MIRELRTLVASPEPTLEDVPHIESLAEALYRKLLGPFEAEITKAETLVVSSDGLLNRLPFTLLKKPRGDFLGGTHVVAYSSASSLIEAPFWETLPSGPAPGPGLILAAPDYGPESPGTQTAGAGSRWVFPPLAATAQEGRTIARMAGKSAKLYTGSEANEHLLRRTRSPRFIHLATHGFYVDGLPRPEVSRQAPGTPNTSDPTMVLQQRAAWYWLAATISTPSAIDRSRRGSARAQRIFRSPGRDPRRHQLRSHGSAERRHRHAPGGCAPE